LFKNATTRFHGSTLVSTLARKAEIEEAITSALPAMTRHEKIIVLHKLVYHYSVLDLCFPILDSDPTIRSDFVLHLPAQVKGLLTSYPTIKPYQVGKYREIGMIVNTTIKRIKNEYPQFFNFRNSLGFTLYDYAMEAKLDHPTMKIMHLV
jgi:hypothetical protein